MLAPFSMNYEDEQKNELEALSEIYYNEIKVISNKTPISFSIKVRPQASNYEEIVVNDSDEESDGDTDDADSDDGSDEGEFVAQQQQLSVELLFRLPPKYPEEKPSIEIISSQNLEEDELIELSGSLSVKAEESLGTVMVFMLVSDVVEWLITKSKSEANEIEHEKELQQKEIEAQEKKRFEGTAVTEQTFLAWKAKFDAEMLKLQLEQQKQQAEPTSTGTRRLTGRAMFESDKTLAESDLNFVEELDQNQLEALLHNIDEIDLQDDEDDDEEFVLDEDDDLDSDSEESDEKEDKNTHNTTSKR